MMGSNTPSDEDAEGCLDRVPKFVVSIAAKGKGWTRCRRSMTEAVILIMVIIVFSMVQSVFGVGLLLFGTPTLLLMGYSYSETLWIVLPSSLSISLAQIYNHYHLVEAKDKVYQFTLPSTLVGLIFILNFEGVFDVARIVGVFLLMIGLLRASRRLRDMLNNVINKSPEHVYVITGLVHGLSNMGGGPLSILMASIHKSKISIRTNIAFVYCWFCLIQLFVLVVFSSAGFSINRVLFPLASLAIYLFFNKVLIEKVKEKKFQSVITFIVLVYGVASVLSFNKT